MAADRQRALWSAALAATLVCGPGLGLVQAESPRSEPLSVIDWLSKSVDSPASARPAASPAPPNGTTANQPPRAGEPPVAKGGALPQDVAVSVIGAPSPDGVGLLAPAVTGFPRNLWGLGLSGEIGQALAGARTDGLPALQGLLLTLLLAETDPPADTGPEGRLLLARIDKLLALGALEQAEALAEAAGPQTSAELFRRAFDIALLTGHEDRACERLKSAPDLAPTLPTRVFCLARAGDWNAAALTLRTAQALGHVSGVEDVLLSRFLDAELAEGEPAPEPPKPVTPLIWRIYDAIGEPLSTAGLPLAFSHGDLDERAGWKAQVEAGERLARAGVIAPNLLLGLYTQRDPAASGGVWDRIDAFQRLDAALQKGDVTAVEQRLPLAYARMADVELEVPFATLFAEKLSALPLTADAARIARDMGYLSPDYRRLSTKAPEPAADDLRGRFLAGLARGQTDGLTPPNSMARAIAPAFAATPPALPPEAVSLLDQKRQGEAILLAITLVETGLHGELGKVTSGLALLRHLGLEDVARRTALELMILERRG